MKCYDVCIIGGGASGLAAAATLKEGLVTCILEKNRTFGKKIMASGGGRCNLTNARAAGADRIIRFFRDLGLEVSADLEGRYYPYSHQAADVLETLLASIRQKNTELITEFSAVSIVSEGGKFSVSDGRRTVRAANVILACGGKSHPELGTTGDGYTMARKLGHSINRLYPILTPVRCDGMPDFAGIRAKGVASLYKDGVLVDREAGEIQFTKDGVSGICIFDLTASMKAEDGERPEEAMRRYEIGLDLAPDFTEEELKDRGTSFGIVTSRLAKVIRPEQLKDYRLQVAGTEGWKKAQCTAGGVRLEEIDEETMESRLLPGLYVTGELLDRQFKCGGFNLQNAWETGMRAAEHINGNYR